MTSPLLCRIIAAIQAEVRDYLIEVIVRAGANRGPAANTQKDE